MDSIALLIIITGVGSLIIGVLLGILLTADRVAARTTDMLLAAIYLYTESDYDSEFRRDFLGGVSEYMRDHGQKIRVFARVLAAERKERESA